ncbi:MAG: undecaprenyl-diphosphatase UppP [Candidatus Nanopelagicales bacterium]
MDLLEAIVLGVLQGATEFLPVSSTAHLRIVPAVAGWEDPGASFTAITQLGTVLAVLAYFAADLARIASAVVREGRRPRSRDAVLGWYILAGTVPIVVLGVAFDDTIEDGARDLTVIGITLIALGGLLWFADRRVDGGRALGDLTRRDAAIIGVAQAGALVPGVSRAGATLTAGLLVGLQREAAARYSFLLSVPAVTAAGVYGLRDLGSGGLPGAAPTVVATAVAVRVGLATISGLLRFRSSHTVAPFVAYRVVLGIVVLALSGSGTVT